MEEPSLNQARNCRGCGATLRRTFIDLGMSPLCERYVPAEKLNELEPFYPLQVYTCEECFLFQIDEYVSPEELFSEYAYFSSCSDSWVEHMRRYADLIASRLDLGKGSLVVEVASNDGYLLQHFVRMGIPVLGIEPAANVAEAAIRKGIPTLVTFFSERTARELVLQGKQADLVCGANVLNHVPKLNEFVKGLQILLKPEGVVTMEFPHLLRLIADGQFDTIYHEHLSYFSLAAAERVFAAQELIIFDVEEIPTHGGSLRIYARHAADSSRPVTNRVQALRQREVDEGLFRADSYAKFGDRVREIKSRLLEFLIAAKRAGKSVAGYGAPGKGNTLLNHCGIRTDFIDFTVDRNSYKQGKYLPGTHIPIRQPDVLREARPDYVLILPWNIHEEIVQQMAFIHEWGGKFVVPIPALRIIE